MSKKKRKPPKRKDYYDVVKRAKAQGIDEVIVGVSGGRDSVATLDLCCKHFSKVRGYFMYIVKDLSFQRRYLSYLKKRFDVDIYEVPAWNLSLYFREGYFRNPTEKSSNVRRLTQKDINRHVRNKLGIEWIATGEKQVDSIERMTQIKSVNAINEDRKVLWPLAVWSHYEVQDHLLREKITSSPEYEMGLQGNNSFGKLWGQNCSVIKKQFPEDYQKIKRRFPLIEAQVIKYERDQRESRKAEEAEKAKVDSSGGSD